MGLRREDAFKTEAVPFKSGNGSYQRYWFYCSECRTEISSQHTYLKDHSGLCRACSHRVGNYAGAYGRLVFNTKRRGMSIELTLEEFGQICLLPDCHYCGTPINRSLVSGEKGYRGYFIDRMDNNVGYVFDNCVPCCWPCNQAKGNRYTYEEFMMISKSLAALKLERSTPHWTDDFGWDDGDSNPDPYYGEMLLTAR